LPLFRGHFRLSNGISPSQIGHFLVEIWQNYLPVGNLPFAAVDVPEGDNRRWESNSALGPFDEASISASSDLKEAGGVIAGGPICDDCLMRPLELECQS